MEGHNIIGSSQRFFKLNQVLACFFVLKISFKNNKGRSNN